MSFNEDGGIRHQTQVKSLRTEVLATLRAIASVIRHPAHKQRVLDLASKLGVSKEVDYGILPAQPEGFVVSNTAFIKNGTGNLRTQCEFQVISMLVMYFFLYSLTQDTQDLRSVYRYKNWITNYAARPDDYEVCGDVRTGFWLCNTSILKEGNKPSLPDWLRADGGETV
jgi:hypothetical protein